ncbi:hypothetical protein FOZ63_006024, partial [Perkinsus olseni]
WLYIGLMRRVKEPTSSSANDIFLKELCKYGEERNAALEKRKEDEREENSIETTTPEELYPFHSTMFCRCRRLHLVGSLIASCCTTVVYCSTHSSVSSTGQDKMAELDAAFSFMQDIARSLKNVAPSAPKKPPPTLTRPKPPPTSATPPVPPPPYEPSKPLAPFKAPKGPPPQKEGGSINSPRSRVTFVRESAENHPRILEMSCPPRVRRSETNPPQESGAEEATERAYYFFPGGGLSIRNVTDLDLERDFFHESLAKNKEAQKPAADSLCQRITESVQNMTSARSLAQDWKNHEK